MGISNYTLKRIFNETKDTLIGGKVERIILIADNDFLLTIFKDGKLYNLLLSLNPSLPIFVLSNSFKVNSINPANYQCNMLKKYLEHAIITNFTKIENDRIVIVDAKKWSDSYQLIETKMIFELFPLSPNIIFVNQNYIILDAFKHSESLDSKHPIYRNLKYEFPQALDKYFDENTPLIDMKNKINKSEYRYLEQLNDIEYKNKLIEMLNTNKYFLFKNDVSSIKICPEAKEISLDELYENLIIQKQVENKENKFQHIFKLVDQKIKSAKKRIINIDKDRNRFLNNENYIELGNLLYMGEDIYQKGDKSITIEGITIQLDPKLNLFDNAQRYFKLHKKAKSGLIQVEIQKENALKELHYFEEIKSQLTFASYDDMQEIILDLVEHGYIKAPKVQNKAKKKPGNKKYTPHFIYSPNGTKIGYGLSSFQNEELTFSLAKKEHTYLHIKDFHGPHVIIFDENPSEEDLRFAGEVALYFANQTSGEVYYTKRYNVKKVATTRGLVTMSTQKTMVIGNILDTTLKILKNR